jgi:hypothetical protein
MRSDTEGVKDIPRLREDKKLPRSNKKGGRAKGSASSSSGAVVSNAQDMQQGNQDTLRMIQTRPATSAPGPNTFQVSAGGFNYQLPQLDLLQEFNRGLQSAYANTASSSDQEQFPHLNDQMPDGRRLAKLMEPSDRAALVKETQDQGRAHKYLKLEAPSSSNSQENFKLGRLQNPPMKGSAKEQHFFDESGSFTPYPREADHLEELATGGKTRKDVWKVLDAVNRGEKPPNGFEAHEQLLMSVPTITNLSEVQRSPLMGASTNLEIANQAHTTGASASFSSAFGTSEERKLDTKRKRNSKKDDSEAENATKKKKKEQVTFNLPGTLSSTGTGAVHQFEAVENSIMNRELSDYAVKKKVKRAPEGAKVAEARNLAVFKKNALLSTYSERLKMTDIERAQNETSAEAREEATLMRLRSGLRRNSMPQMGLLRTGLRTLEKQTASSSGVSNADVRSPLDDAENDLDETYDPTMDVQEEEESEDESEWAKHVDDEIEDDEIEDEETQ